MELIENKITDRKFTRIIWKSLRARHFEFKKIAHNTIGTFQGSIISPILANIFLHQLDLTVSNLKKEFDKGKESKVTPEYNRLRYQERKMRQKGLIEEADRISKERLRTVYSDFKDESYKKLEYVRYADD